MAGTRQEYSFFIFASCEPLNDLTGEAVSHANLGEWLRHQCL